MKSILFCTLLTVSVSGSAALANGGPVHPMPPVTCSWPAWENCGDTHGDVVDMTCAQAKAQVQHHGAGHFVTEDGGTIGPVYAHVNCSGEERVKLVNIRTTDEMNCTVGQTCALFGGGGH